MRTGADMPVYNCILTENAGPVKPGAAAGLSL